MQLVTIAIGGQLDDLQSAVTAVLCVPPRRAQPSYLAAMFTTCKNLYAMLEVTAATWIGGDGHEDAPHAMPCIKCQARLLALRHVVLLSVRRVVPVRARREPRGGGAGAAAFPFEGGFSGKVVALRVAQNSNHARGPCAQLWYNVENGVDRPSVTDLGPSSNPDPHNSRGNPEVPQPHPSQRTRPALAINSCDVGGLAEAGCGSVKNVTRKCGICARTASGQVTLGELSWRSPKLTNSFTTVVEQLLREAGLGPNSARIGRIWPIRAAELVTLKVSQLVPRYDSRRGCGACYWRPRWPPRRRRPRSSTRASSISTSAPSGASSAKLGRRSRGTRRSLEWPPLSTRRVQADRRVVTYLLRPHPYSLRHGGASRNAMTGARTIEQIRMRGRWKAESSVRRMKHSRAMREEAILPPADEESWGSRRRTVE